MNATERRAIARVKVLVLAGERTEAVDLLRRLETLRSPRRPEDDSRQLLLAFAVFRCETLDVDDMPARLCVTRQLASEAQRTKDTWRGQGTSYPSCDSRKCRQGEAIRATLDPRAVQAWRGCGPGGRFEREKRRSEKAVQYAARDKRAAEGALDQPSTLDRVSTGEEEP